jgi:GrpB-like predicted nucleotidyltransferase (UPF0157 family)
MSTPVRILAPRDDWPQAYDELEARLAPTVAPWAGRIDHIGSTSVPGLAAKDIIDIQVTVAQEGDLDPTIDALTAAGWVPSPYQRDHVAPGAPEDDAQWVKRLVTTPPDERRANVHIRVADRANQRYALLFRDYLRARPDTAEAYSRFKQLAAELVTGGAGDYTDLKDPVCDLIYLPAEEWAGSTGWRP